MLGSTILDHSNMVDSCSSCHQSLNWDRLCGAQRIFGEARRELERSQASAYCSLTARVAQNAQGVFKGVIEGVTRASFGRRAPRMPQLKRASARRREEKDFRGV